MNNFTKTVAVATAVLVGGLSIAETASAGDWRRRYYDGHVERDNGDAALAAGIAGLAAGVIAGAIISQPRPAPRVYYTDPQPPVYYREPQPRVIYRNPAPRPVRYYDDNYNNYAGGVEPWTRDWYRYCQNRYQSFDSRSGTYLGYDGERHFCVAN